MRLLKTTILVALSFLPSLAYAQRINPNQIAPPASPASVSQSIACIASGTCAWSLPGVLVDSTNPATLLATDRITYLKWTSGSTLTLPAASGAFASNMPFVIQNTSGGALAITPTTPNNIDGGSSQAASSLPNNASALVYQDASQNWWTIKFYNTATSAGANTALSNLASVAVNLALAPGTDNSISLDSLTKRFINAWLSGVLGWTNGSGTADTGVSRDSAGVVAAGNGTAGDASGTFKAAAFRAGAGGPACASWAGCFGTGGIQSLSYNTATNCSSSASPAVCGSASAGSVTIAAAATTIVVNTSAVTANSQIFVFPDETLGTKLSVTCNSTLATAASGLAVTARTAGTSFTISTLATVAVNPVCLSYLVTN